VPPYLELKGIAKSYGDGAPTVAGFDLAVMSGEFITLLGPSGCGKTTVLRIIAGLLAPTTGTVLLKGEDITARPTHLRNMGFVFQNYALFPHLSIERNVAFGLEMRGISGAKAHERTGRALDLVRLSAFRGRRPKELSGGQQQRAALARALVIEPAVLLLDEPLSNLDAKLREELRDEIREIQRRLGITTIFVTHDQSEALTMSDRIVVMEGGRVEQVANPVDIYERPATPFVAGFIGRTNRLQAIVRASAAEGATLAAGDETFTVRGALRAGHAVTAMIRPHRMRLAKTASGGDANVLAARIRKVTFAGETIEYDVEAAGTTLLVESPTSPVEGLRFAEGDNVSLCWDPADTMIFPR